jgi:hypothetical protein
MKVCCKCKIEKNNDEFYNKRTECILCAKEYRKLYYKQNSETFKERSKLRNKINPEYSKTYQNNNREKFNSTAKKWRDNNPEKSVESSLKWRSKNTTKYNEYQRFLRSNNEIVNLSSNIRNRLNKYIKQLNIRKNNTTFEIVGCTPQFLKEYLEKQFLEGMSWENRNKWHIDHIIPLSSAKDECEFYKLCYYTNLQPLWASDNMKKSNKIIN